MSVFTAFTIGVAIVAVGGWAMVGWLAWLKHRDAKTRRLAAH